MLLVASAEPIVRNVLFEASADRLECSGGQRQGNPRERRRSMAVEGNALKDRKTPIRLCIEIEKRAVVTARVQKEMSRLNESHYTHDQHRAFISSCF